MQAKLPDINAAIVRHRSNALQALDQNELNKAAISLGSINALLPEDYQLEVNTAKYYSLIEAKHTITCLHCNEVMPITEAKVWPLLLSSIDRLISGNKTMKVWECPNCKGIVPFAESPKGTTEFQKPFFVKVVPELPVRIGFRDRIGFNQRFVIWFDIVIEELEHQIGLYRADYQAQQAADQQPGFDDDE